MNRSQQKKIARRKLSEKDRHDRFISRYVKARYSEVYQEAEGFFNQLLAGNPERRDLTKTHEFLLATTSFKSHDQYYNRKRGLRKQLCYDMELKIPLLTQDSTISNTEQPLEIASVNVTEEPLVISDVSNTEQPLEIASVNVTEEPLVISDDLYHDLIRELRSDPELYSIFNDMNIPETIPDKVVTKIPPEPENINDIIQELCDSMELNEQTALERELAALGY